jgi:hypothetical protein
VSPQYFSRPPPYYLLPETRYDAILAGLCPSDPYKSNLSRRLSFRHRGGSDQRRGVPRAFRRTQRNRLRLSLYGQSTHQLHP